MFLLDQANFVLGFRIEKGLVDPTQVFAFKCLVDSIPNIFLDSTKRVFDPVK